MFKKRLHAVALILAIAAVACELAAMRLHGQLKIALASRNGGTEGLAASTDRARLLGLALAGVAVVAAVVDIRWTGRLRRANLYSLVLVLVAISLFFVS